MTQITINSSTLNDSPVTGTVINNTGSFYSEKPEGIATETEEGNTPSPKVPPVAKDALEIIKDIISGLISGYYLKKL